MTDIVLASMLVAGGLFGAVGALGLVRMPDVLIRMHASTKIGTLSCGLIIAASAVHFGLPEITVRAVAIVIFLFLTAPIAAHMIGRAAVSTGVPLWKDRELHRTPETPSAATGEDTRD